MPLFGKDKDDKGVGVAAPPMIDRDAMMRKRYQSVVDLVNSSGGSVENVHMENDKLLIRAEAPSEQVKNQVWDHIKTVNPAWANDLVADISVRPGQGGGTNLPPGLAPGAGPGSGAGTATSGERTYTVKPGDTLSKISQQLYGNANQYNRIFEANRDQLSDPDKIQVGQQLRIPG